MRWMLALALLPAPLRAVDVHPISRASLAVGMDVHIDNLALLQSLPPVSASGADLSPVDHSYGDIPASDLQAMYLRELSQGAATDQAVLEALTRAASGPRAAAVVADAIRDGGEGDAVAAKLLRWSAGARAIARNAEDDPSAAGEALAAIFDGSYRAAQSAADHSILIEKHEALERRSHGALTAAAYVPVPSPHTFGRWFSHPTTGLGWIFRGLDPIALDRLLIDLPAAFQSLARAVSGADAAVASVEDEIKTHWRDSALLVLKRRQTLEGGLIESFSGIVPLIETYRLRGIGSDGLRLILERTTAFGRFMVIHDPLTWNAIPPSHRLDLLRTLHGWAVPALQGQRLTLRIAADDDIAAIARKYAAGRNPALLETSIRRLLGPHRSVALPLERLLPPAVARNLDGFRDCTGKDCAATALEAALDRPYNPRAIASAEIPLRVAESSNYTKVRDGSSAVGDVIVYYKRVGATRVFHHAAYDVGDGYMLTKDGMSRYSPTVFKSKAGWMKANDMFGELEVEVYRPIPFNEAATPTDDLAAAARTAPASRRP